MKVQPMIANEVDLPSPCLVPTSELGKQYGVGTIVARWRNKAVVNFSGHVAHLTVARHVFLEVAP